MWYVVIYGKKNSIQVYTHPEVVISILLKYKMVMISEWTELLYGWNDDDVRKLLSAHNGFNGIRKPFHLEPSFDGWAWMCPARGHP